MKLVKVSVGPSNGRNRQGVEVEGSALVFEQDVKEFFANCTPLNGMYSEWAWLADEKQAFEAVIKFGCYDYYTGGIKTIEVMYESAADSITDALHGVLSRLQVAAAQVEAQTACGVIENRNPGFSIEGPGWNQHANAPIPGPNMASFNELMLSENCCTDELQHQLDDGWRVMAVCPQEARRPDYILGRFNSVRNPKENKGALRG